MKNTKLVIFDLDGTLLDTVPDVHTCVNYSLKKLGLPEISLAQTKMAIGPGVTEFAKISLGSKNSHRFDEFLFHYRVCYKKLKLENTKPFKNIEHVLDGLQNYTLAVATNKPLGASLQALKKCKLDHYFQAVAGPELVVKVKPFPDMIDYLLQTLHFDTTQTLLVGDTENDLLAARAAKIKICIAGWGYFFDKNYLKQQADYYIENPLDLINLLMIQYQKISPTHQKNLAV